MSQMSSELICSKNKMPNGTIEDSISRVTKNAVEKLACSSELSLPRKKRMVCEKNYRSFDVIHSQVTKNNNGIVVNFYKTPLLVTKDAEIYKHKVVCSGESSRKLINLDNSANVSENPIKKLLVQMSDKENIVENKNKNLSGHANKKQNTQEIKLFDIILAQRNRIKMPSSCWALHYCFDSKVIIVSCVQILLNKDKIQTVIPESTKEVVVHDDSCIQIRILGQDYNWIDIPSIPQNFPESLADFEELLNALDKLMICVGGPPIRQFKNINPRSAYKDLLVWRHNKCPVVLERGKICLRCSGLHQTLRRHLHKNIKCCTKPKSKASRQS